MTARTIALLTLLVAPIVAASNASAQSRHPLRTSGEAYREAVKDFERAVFRADDMGRSQRRLADALEDQSSRVRNESRNLDDLPRLQAELQTAAALHAQIEQTILANPYAASMGVLGPTWQYVVQTYDQVCAQVQSLVNPIYNDPYAAGYAPSPHVDLYGPSPYLAPAPSAIVPSYRVPSYRVPSYRVPIVPDCPDAYGFPVYRQNPVGRHHVGAYLQR